ncbi:hypothetical protein D3Z52_10155 [Clostridiaceae bacterium]|nr:hypothetical protein [Clostridiaceae bacterium]
MNNEEKILTLLTQMQSDLSDVKTTQSEHGEQLTELSDRLGSVETTLAEHSEQLAAHGEQLAELRDRQLRMEMNLEHTVIPRLDILCEGQQLLQDTLARKDSVEDIRDALTEWETANNVSFSEVWNRVAKLEKVK